MSTEIQKDIYIGGNVVEPSPAFQVMQGITEGSIPTNQNMVSSLKEMEEALKMHAGEKKGAESRFAKDAERFIRHAREIIEEKNKDDTLRTMMLHIKEASDLLAESVPNKEELAAKGEELRNKGATQLQHLVDSFKGLVMSFIRNTKLRMQMIDIIQLLEEALSEVVTAAVKVEEKLEEKTDLKLSSEASEKLDQAKQKAEKTLTTSQKRQKMREMMVEMASTPEYKEFINSVTSFFQTNWQYLSTFFQETAVSNKTSAALLVVISDIQTLLERFSGGKSLKPLQNHLYSIFVTISRDGKIRHLVERWRDFINKTFDKPESLDLQALDREMTSLIDTGTGFFLNKEKLQENVGGLLKESKAFFERLRDDSALNKVTKDFANIRKELIRNESGKMDLTTLKNSLPTLKNVLIPTLTTALRNIPIPAITVDNEKYFLQLSNLSMAAQDLIPEKIRIHFTNDVVFDFTTDANDRFLSKLTVLMRDFNARLQDINFKYDRKVMPQISDFGIADVEINGIDIDIKWRMEMNDSTLCFYIDDVKCLIDSLNTNIKEANHKLLDNIYLTLFSGGMKQSIEQTIEETIRDKMLEFSVDTNTPLSEQIPSLPQA